MLIMLLSTLPALFIVGCNSIVVYLASFSELKTLLEILSLTTGFSKIIINFVY